MKELKNFFIKYKYIILFLLGIFLLFCRNAYNFMMPTMYAEDGYWFGRILTSGTWDTLLHARIDFFVAIPVLLLKLADIIDIVFGGGGY